MFIINASAATDRGLVREANQDAVYQRVTALESGDSLALLIVADGVGGHKAGQLASRLAVQAIHHSVADLFGDVDASVTQPLRDIAQLESERRPAEYLGSRLRRAVEQANTALYQYASEHREEAGNMGSTVTCALIKGNLAVGANVGDSRTYLLANGELVQLTRDHSLVYQMIEAGQLPPDAVYDHPQRNVIMRSLGNMELIKVDMWQRELEAGEQLLLCSDGLWELLRDESIIVSTLRDSPPAESVRRLIAAANAAGGTDNVGVVAAQICSS